MENRKVKILAIDDNRDNLISLKAIIAEVIPKSVVYAVESGQSGIESARKNEPDVILLDIVMPRMDGYEVCRILKADEQLSETPIIFLTALKGDKQSRIMALEAGGEAFLAKPIDATELKAQIVAMLKIKEAATYRRDQRLLLEELVQKRTEELKSANIAALNLLEDLKTENEIRKQNELELKKSEENLKLLNRAVEASSVAVEITDAEGNINYVNPFFTELTGYSYEEALGKNPRFLQSGNHPNEFYKDLWDTILSGKDWTGEFQNKKKNGELYWENAVISPIMNSNGKVTHFVAIKEDVTESKRVMAELSAAKEKAEESDRLKTAFLHNISHEIRTPMNAIIGFSALLSEPGIDEESRNFYTETITQSSDQLLSIINDIVDISNIEAGIVNISKEEIRINRSLDRLKDKFNLKAKEKAICLRTVSPLPDEEAIIFADNTKFTQVISNLLSNAFKFTNEGTVEFGYKPGKGFIEFYVSDTGIGIPNDQQSKIFDRFYQVDFEMARLNEGTGLGLAISKSFIDLMGGEIWVESVPGKGSTFFFTLPFSGLQKREETVLPVKRQYTFDREYNILVAEDDTQNSYLIDIFLGNQNLKVTIVSNGAEAVEHCRTGKPVDLVLMDLKMPVMDGFEATRLIKEIRPDLPVIAQTAYASEDDKKRALSSGCNDLITKPFRIETLISKIRDNFTPSPPGGS